MGGMLGRELEDRKKIRQVTSIHLPQYDEIYNKVRNRLGRIMKSKKHHKRNYRELALSLIDTAHNIIVDKLKPYREFYLIINNNAQLHNYIKDVYGTKGLQSVREAAYLGNSVTRLWKTLRKHLQYAPLDGIVNESLNYAARLLSMVKRKRRLLQQVLEIKKDVARTPLVKRGTIPLIVVGPPNAGKSTLASKLADIEMEVGDYPFTTKKVQAAKKNVGEHYEMLVMDTPGILNFENPNLIERRALAYIKQPDSILLFLLDPTPEASMPLDEQLELLQRITELNPNIVVVVNKIDRLGQEYEKVLSYISSKIAVDTRVFAVSALKDTNLDTLINYIKNMVLESKSRTAGLRGIHGEKQRNTV